MIETTDGLRITVSRHAADAALKRHPELAGRRVDDAVYWAENRALEALRASRKARTCPRWCVRVWTNGFTNRRKMVPSKGTTRFIWDEAQTFVMLATRVAKGCGGNPDHWHIITVMTPERPALPLVPILAT